MWTDLRQLSIRRRAGKRLYQADCEQLEERLALNAATDTPPLVTSDIAAPVIQPMRLGLLPEHRVIPEPPQQEVEVTATHIITHSETIPRFAAQPTITNTRGGDWSDPSIW